MNNSQLKTIPFGTYIGDIKCCNMFSQCKLNIECLTCRHKHGVIYHGYATSELFNVVFNRNLFLGVCEICGAKPNQNESPTLNVCDASTQTSPTSQPLINLEKRLSRFGDNIVVQNRFETSNPENKIYRTYSFRRFGDKILSKNEFETSDSNDNDDDDDDNNKNKCNSYGSCADYISCEKYNLQRISCCTCEICKKNYLDAVHNNSVKNADDDQTTKK